MSFRGKRGHREVQREDRVKTRARLAVCSQGEPRASCPRSPGGTALPTPDPAFQPPDPGPASLPSEQPSGNFVVAARDATRRGPVSRGQWGPGSDRQGGPGAQCGPHAGQVAAARQGLCPTTAGGTLCAPGGRQRLPLASFSLSSTIWKVSGARARPAFTSRARFFRTLSLAIAFLACKGKRRERSSLPEHSWTLKGQQVGPEGPQA